MKFFGSQIKFSEAMQVIVVMQTYSQVRCEEGESLQLLDQLTCQRQQQKPLSQTMLEA